MKRVYNSGLIAIVATLLFITCRRVDLSTEKQDSLIQKSKTWFDGYLAKGELSNNFKNANFIWSSAKIFTFTNGYKVVTVPVIEKNQNVSYAGRRILYLYPRKNGKGFYSCLYELNPTFEHYQKNKGKINLKYFDGYISTWDLKTGFVQGAKYINGVSEKNITIEYSQSRLSANLSSSQNRISPTWPNITITYIIPAPASGYYFITITNTNGYSMNYIWGSGGGSSGNICEYTGCYNPQPEDFFEPDQLNEIMQELADREWLDNIKDSTNNPCDSTVIANLKDLTTETLPKLFREIFDNSANIGFVFKSSDLGAGVGGQTTPNLLTNIFQITLNDHFSDRSTLSAAATILHEMVHGQLMDWYRQAITNNDIALQQSLATDYHFYFDSSSVVENFDVNFLFLMNQNQGGQHQIFTFENIRQEISDALFEFAYRLDPNPPIGLAAYCDDLAWAGTYDSKGFQNLPPAEQNRLTAIIEGERGNVPLYVKKGAPCPQ